MARLLQGLAGSAGIVVSLAVARDLYSGAELSRMLSLLALVSASAPIVAPVLGGQLSRFLDWRGIFFVLSGIGITLFLLAYRSLNETLPDRLRHGGGLRTIRSQLAVLSRDRTFMTILLAAAAAGVGFFSYLSMSSFVLEKQYGLSPQLFSLVFAANALVNLGGSQLSRLLVRRLGPLRMYLTGQTASIVAGLAMLAVTAFGAGLGALIGTLMLFLLSVGIGGPNGTTLALRAHGLRAGTAAAVLGMVMFTVGPVIGPLASLGGASATAMAIRISAGAAAAALLAWTLVWRRTEVAEVSRRRA